MGSPNNLLYSKVLQFNGTFSALTSFAHSGVTGLYLTDGAVILKAGTQSIIGGKLPVNVTSNASGYGLSLNAVSVHGSSISASNYGATQITLSNSLSTTINYYGGQLVHLVSGTQIPYTAVVGNITLTRLSYTIVGSLSGSFNYSLYEEFGKGQPTTGGKWVLPISSLSALSTQNGFSILLTAKSQNLHSISLNYNSFILGGL